jgi:hypothetical protein
VDKRNAEAASLAAFDTIYRALLDLPPRIPIVMKESGMIVAPARTTSAEGWRGPEEQVKSGAERVFKEQVSSVAEHSPLAERLAFSRDRAVAF